MAVITINDIANVIVTLTHFKNTIKKPSLFVNQAESWKSKQRMMHSR